MKRFRVLWNIIRVTECRRRVLWLPGGVRRCRARAAAVRARNSPYRRCPLVPLCVLHHHRFRRLCGRRRSWGGCITVVVSLYGILVVALATGVIVGFYNAARPRPDPGHPSVSSERTGASPRPEQGTAGGSVPQGAGTASARLSLSRRSGPSRRQRAPAPPMVTGFAPSRLGEYRPHPAEAAGKNPCPGRKRPAVRGPLPRPGPRQADPLQVSLRCRPAAPPLPAEPPDPGQRGHLRLSRGARRRAPGRPRCPSWRGLRATAAAGPAASGGHGRDCTAVSARSRPSSRA